MNVRPMVYSGAPDRQMEAFMEDSAFLRAIVFGVLFQGDLVIPDIFFYISNKILKATKEPSTASFLKGCLRNGALIPAYRSDTKGSFRDNLAEIRKQGIQGLLGEADEVAGFLENSIVGIRPYYICWPAQPFSVGFREIVQRVLVNGVPIFSSPDAERLWEETEKMRPAIVSNASLDSLGGLRRGDLNNALAEYLNPGKKMIVDDVGTIGDGVADLRLVSAARRLAKWINYCYYFNQGRMFGSNPGLTALDDIDCDFAAHLAGLASDGKSAPMFAQEFLFPSAEGILTVDPVRLFEVRNSQVGQSYFSAMESWQNQPSEEHAQVLLDALNDYTNRLTHMFLQHGRTATNWGWHLRAIIPAGETRWSSIGVEAMKATASDLVGLVVPFLGSLSMVGKVAAATYEYLPKTMQESLGPSLGLNRRVLIRATGMTNKLSAHNVAPCLSLKAPAAKTDATFR